MCLLILSCCGPGTAGPLDAPAFDAARAWADLEQLVALGPRPLGTAALDRARAYLRGELEPLGWQIEEDPFPVSAPAGARRRGDFTGKNLIARRAGTAPGEIWLASHLDTYDLPGFVGANDGGSSSAVLLELGRQLAGAGPRRGPSLVLCWFDGEEPFNPLPWDNETNSTFGSRHAVARLQAAGTIGEVKALVLLDMVGDARLAITLPEETAPWLGSLFERTAARLGHGRLFAESRPIRDDHVPFYEAGVPVIDLIDLRFGPGLLNDWWHKPDDTLDKCSADSLGTIGALVLAALPEIERHLAAGS